MSRTEKLVAHDFDIKALARYLRTYFQEEAEMEAAKRITAYVQFDDREVAAIWEQVLEELQRQKASGEECRQKFMSQTTNLYQQLT